MECLLKLMEAAVSQPLQIFNGSCCSKVVLSKSTASLHGYTWQWSVMLKHLILRSFVMKHRRLNFHYAYLVGSSRSVAVNLIGGFLVLPSSLGFSSLQSLSLISVKMANNFGELISSFCECLEELRLEDIEEIYNISIKSSSLLRFTSLESCLASQLHHLRIAGGKLEVVHVFWRFDSSTGKSLKIFAPSLKYLTWNGNPTNDYFLDPFVQSEGARLFLEPKIRQ